MRSTVTRLLGRAAVAMSVIATLTVGVAQAGTIDPDRSTVLITGSNRGIGLAFAEYYTAAGWNVLATARSPEQATELLSLAEGYEHLIIEQLDVTDNERIAVLAEVYRDTSIDLLINNAGVLGDLDKQRWGSLDPSTFDQVLAVNVFAPMKMAEAFADHVAASEHKKIVSITSGAGSVSPDRRAGGFPVYGISKAALNMAMRKVRAELAGRGIIVALIAPGTVATDMLAAALPNRFAAAQTAAQSVAAMASVIEGLDQSYDGRPRNYDGSVMPW